MMVERDNSDTVPSLYTQEFAMPTHRPAPCLLPQNILKVPVNVVEGKQGPTYKQFNYSFESIASLSL